MFDSLKALISNLVDEARLRNRFESKDCLLATAALLIRVATVDKEMSGARRRKLHAVLQSSFELDDLTTIQLIDDADAAEQSAIDLYHFTRQLNDAIDDDGCRQIVKSFLVKSCGSFWTNFEWLSSFVVVAVGMWATRLRCPSCPQRLRRPRAVDL
jgi:uncharacterized tellurite resistance protein B-like protein